MATKRSKRNMDRKLVSEQPHEKRYEAKKMNVSPKELSKAKKIGGRSRKAIEAQLKGGKKKS